jgi:2'-deoxynucleoside 5'-phosphate N-hydrolase
VNIYLGIKYHPDGLNRPDIESIAALLEAQGHVITCVFRDLENWGVSKFEPRELMSRTFDIIDATDLVLIDLSEKGVGLGIEAGYAYARRKTIVTIAKSGSDISDTLRGISADVIIYDTHRNLAEKLSRWLKP